MSYLVLARKWRPQTFSDLVGQEHVSRTLKNAIEGGRVAHAFLFTGARGVGKTSSARILAKALNCEQGPSVEPCNVCSACSEITEGNSVDVFEIDGASNTSVDDIRELRENIKYLPSRSRYKIFIIDEVHMLSTSAFNALLKTLEEPPPHVKFIFATTEPHKVPITILSRCQRFDFKRIAPGRIVARLRFIVDQEGVGISDEALALVARKGDGSMRDSLSTLDQVLAFCGERVEDADVASLLGVVDRRLLLQASRSVLARDTRGALEVAAKVDSFGYSMRQFCQELIDHFRSIVVLGAVGDPGELLELSEGELEELRPLAASTPLEELQRHLAILLKAEGEMAQASFPRLILELALMRMAALPPAVPVRELLARLKALEGAPPPLPQGGAAPRPAPRPAAPAAPPPPPESAPRPAAGAPAASRPEPTEVHAPTQADPGPDAATPLSEADLADLWGSLVRFIKGKRPMLASILEQVRPVRVSREALEIGCPAGSYQLQSLMDQDNQRELKRLASEHFGRVPTLRVAALRDTAEEAPLTLEEKKSLEDAERRDNLRREAEAHPLVVAALELFDGEISEIEEVPQQR